VLNASFNKRVLPSRCRNEVTKFWYRQKIKIIREGTFGFAAVGGFLFYFLPPKSEEAKISDFQEKSLKSRRRLNKNKSEDIYVFKTTFLNIKKGHLFSTPAIGEPATNVTAQILYVILYKN